MRVPTKVIVVACTILFGLYIAEHPESSRTPAKFVASVDTIKSSTIEPIQSLLSKPKPKFKGKIQAFLRQMGQIEGLGSYETVSSRGYLGMYQFHPRTLAYIGINVTRNEFLSNPDLQDSTMVAYMRMNARVLDKVIKHYSGTYVNGVYVTKAGILAGAHLVGTGGVLTFLRPDKYDYKTVDGNGVHVSTYMTKFAGYDLRGL